MLRATPPPGLLLTLTAAALTILPLILLACGIEEPNRRPTRERREIPIATEQTSERTDFESEGRSRAQGLSGGISTEEAVEGDRVGPEATRASALLPPVALAPTTTIPAPSATTVPGIGRTLPPPTLATSPSAIPDSDQTPTQALPHCHSRINPAIRRRAHPLTSLPHGHSHTAEWEHAHSLAHANSVVQGHTHSHTSE